MSIYKIILPKGSIYKVNSIGPSMEPFGHDFAIVLLCILGRQYDLLDAGQRNIQFCSITVTENFILYLVA